MKSLPIRLGYEGLPIGRVLLDDIDEKALASSAIVPAIKHDRDGDNVEVTEWGLIQRTRVDTRPQAILGEKAQPIEITDEMVERGAQFYDGDWWSMDQRREFAREFLEAALNP